MRLESPGLRGSRAQQLHEAVGADLVIDPDDAVAREVLDLLAYPGAIEIARLADNEVLMIGAKLDASAPFVGQTLSDIGARYSPQWDFIVCTITRDGRTIVPRKDHELRAGDNIRVVCKTRRRAPM